MRDERLFSFKNPWFSWSIGILAAAVLLSLMIGFIWVPNKQNPNALAGLWDAICRAAGVPVASEPTAPDSRVFRASEVVVSPQMLTATELSVGRGATLAQNCTMCHGIRGMSAADTPNLAGQFAEATYKQLRDYQSGHRKSAIMQPLVRRLTDQDMRDLAAYYASLARTVPPADLLEQLRAPPIVQIGSPMRNIAPCVSCHGGSDVKATAPLLDGASAQYLRDQMRAFADGSRNNDIHAQMRNIARQMTPEEIETTARYYSRR